MVIARSKMFEFIFKMQLPFGVVDLTSNDLAYSILDLPDHHPNSEES